MYNDKVMEEFAHPENIGYIENNDGYGKVGNASCGDIMEITIKVEDNIIKDAKFRTFGCAAAIASSSVATRMIIGKSIDYAKSLTNADVVEELEGLPPQKIHCSVLAEEAISKAVDDYLSKGDKDKSNK
ncbi:MAG: iron-sulfur cluster assembly scaffold protein [Clostridia bacterium]